MKWQRRPAHLPGRARREAKRRFHKPTAKPTTTIQRHKTTAKTAKTTLQRHKTTSIILFAPRRRALRRGDAFSSSAALVSFVAAKSCALATGIGSDTWKSRSLASPETRSISHPASCAIRWYGSLQAELSRSLRVSALRALGEELEDSIRIH